MEKGEFFALSFEEQLQFICRMRHQLSKANTKKEKEEAIPQWLIERAEEFEGEHRFESFGNLFSDSLLFSKGHEDNIEIACIMHEIIGDLLHLSILENENVIGLSWTEYIGEEAND